MPINFLGLLVLSYLLGSIPFGLVVARALKGPDPRGLGSGNLGAANLYRQLGLKGGGLTLLGDALKGAAPVLLARFWLIPPGPWHEAAVALVGAAAVLGHVFPLYLGFKGGKGVATALGVVLALCPLAGLSLVLHLPGGPVPDPHLFHQRPDRRLAEPRGHGSLFRLQGRSPAGRGPVGADPGLPSGEPEAVFPRRGAADLGGKGKKGFTTEAQRAQRVTEKLSTKNTKDT